ncbi:fibronectin type III domain-containing protein [Blastococcus aurantiacus]|nr:fibronectin type III domain-containing protein [Blastococcus aurantiacus]
MSARRVRAALLAMLVIASGTALAAPPGLSVARAAADTAPPALVAFDFTPRTVDISAGPASVTVSARITDATGAEAPTISFTSDTTSQTAGFGSMTRTSGTAQDGTYTRTITIPKGAAPGTWSASLFPLSDTLGNDGTFGPPPGFPKTLTVTAGASVTAPGPPRIGTPSRGDASATARWTAPASTGGSAITGYTIRTYRGTTLVKTTYASASATALAVTGLRNGSAHTFTVAAKNARGTGAFSARSAAVTPATVPGQPRIGTPSRGNASATARWTAPASTGGSAITGYTIRTYRGTTLVKTTYASASATALAVTGLRNGSAHTFTVAAKNARGTGAFSARSAAVTPIAPPPLPPAPAPTYYANCDAVRAAGKAPLLRGQPGYSTKLDRDGDGVACEP